MEEGGGARERINGPTLSLPQIPSRCRTRPPCANCPSVPSVRRFPIPALLQRMSLYLSWFVRPAAVVLKASHFLLFVSFPRPEISPNQLRTNSSSVTQMQKLLSFLLPLGPFLPFGSPFVSEQPRSVAVGERLCLALLKISAAGVPWRFLNSKQNQGIRMLSRSPLPFRTATTSRRRSTRGSASCPTTRTTTPASSLQVITM